MEGVIAHWFPKEAYQAEVGRLEGQQRNFANVEDAVTFIMTNVPHDTRTVAWIECEFQNIEFTEIHKIYRQMKDGGG